MNRPTLDDVALFHQNMMDRAMILTNGNEQRSKDLVQVTYLKIGERLLDETKEQPTNINLSYCMTVLKNSFLDELKNKKTRATIHTEELEGFEIGNPVEENENMETFRKFLNQVPYIEREILLQHQEKTQVQIKEETGVCRPRLRMYRNRGMDKLQEIIAKKEFKVKYPTLLNQKHLSDKDVAQIENEIYNGRV